jgi:hypothetical protein
LEISIFGFGLLLNQQTNQFLMLSFISRKKHTCCREISKLIDKRLWKTYTFNRSCTWYPYEWWLLKVKHASSPYLWEKHYRKKTIQSLRTGRNALMITFHVEEGSAYKYEFEDNPWSLLQIYRSMSLRLTWYRSESETGLTRSSGHKIE